MSSERRGRSGAVSVRLKLPQPNPEIALSSGASSWLETKQTPEMAAIAESAMMSAGRGGGMDAGAARAARARAYEDLVAGGVLACSDYGRKDSLVQWALRCKSML